MGFRSIILIPLYIFSDFSCRKILNAKTHMWRESNRTSISQIVIVYFESEEQREQLKNLFKEIYGLELRFSGTDIRKAINVKIEVFGEVLGEKLIEELILRSNVSSIKFESKYKSLYIEASFLDYQWKC